MKANLMYSDKDTDQKASPCFNYTTLLSDLELKKMLLVMAKGDETVMTACTTALFSPLMSIDRIRYRQENLKDALSNSDVIRLLYEITTETLQRKKSSWHWLGSRNLSSTFSSAVELLRLFTEMLMKLRIAADENLHRFHSAGFVDMLSMIQQELSDDYFFEVRAHLDDLKDRGGTLISSTIGSYLHGVGYVFRRKNKKAFWRRWRFAPSFTIAPRDDAGARDLGNRRDRAMNETVNALAQAAEHLEYFLIMLRSELAFYMGCINLADSLQRLGMPICIPEILSEIKRDCNWLELYDVSLALTMNSKVVGNELEGYDKSLYIITGANQGGKSTFLRSIGQAQLMAQCGMFVGAQGFTAPIQNGVFSHFKKEEDAAMKSGKLDEELSRMDEIIEHLNL